MIELSPSRSPHSTFRSWWTAIRTLTSSTVLSHQHCAIRALELTTSPRRRARARRTQNSLFPIEMVFPFRRNSLCAGWMLSTSESSRFIEGLPRDTLRTSAVGMEPQATIYWIESIIGRPTRGFQKTVNLSPGQAVASRPPDPTSNSGRL